MQEEISLYNQLRRNPPQIKLKGELNKIIINMVSCMCNNKSQIIIMKKDNIYSIWSTLSSGMGYAMSNYGMKHTTSDIIWEAEDHNWDKVIEMINSGTSVIESIKAR